MALINTTTAGLAASGSYDSAPSSLYGCKTTLANIGPLTSAYTAPATCETPVFSQLVTAGTTLFPCPDYVAYKSCLPHAEVLSSYSNSRASSYDYGCDAFMTYFSPGISCPAAWQTAAAFTLSESNYTIASATPKSVSTLLFGQFPVVGGTHRLCCPRYFPYMLLPANLD